MTVCHSCHEDEKPLHFKKLCISGLFGYAFMKAEGKIFIPNMGNFSVIRSQGKKFFHCLCSFLSIIFNCFG